MKYTQIPQDTGSSPRVRGAGVVLLRKTLVRGIIPARAGSSKSAKALKGDL